MAEGRGEAVFERDGIEIEHLRFGPALGMALMESLGIPEYLDEVAEWSPQRVLSPGKAVKAIAGTMFTENHRQALHNVALFYRGAPVDRLFGPRAEERSLCDKSLGRAMDCFAGMDTESLMWAVAGRAKAAAGLAGLHRRPTAPGTTPGLEDRVAARNVDPSNITIHRSPGEGYGDLPEGVPRPMLGHPKDGSTGRVQYNHCTVTDEWGLPEYVRTWDGNRDDNAMISEAVRFLEEHFGELMDDRRMVAVADGKMMFKGLVEHMLDEGTLFVSKPPRNFCHGVCEEVVREALEKGLACIGRIGSRKDSPEIHAYETARECFGHELRFIVYRKGDLGKAVRHDRRMDALRLKEMKASMERASFESREAAERAYAEALAEAGITTHSTTHSVRLRRRADGGEEWKVSMKHSFDERMAVRAASEDVEVMATNLPAPGASGPEAADGPEASAFDVVALYFGQWKVESCFKEMKSGLGADTVYLQRPDREKTMILIIHIAALVRGIMKQLLRLQYGKGHAIPYNVTPERVFLLTQNVRVTYDRSSGTMRLSGSAEDMADAMSFVDALGIDPSRLLGRPPPGRARSAQALDVSAIFRQRCRR